MYDDETATLIRHIPDIGGVDKNRLPEILTEAYVDIAALRLRLGNEGTDDNDALRAAARRLRTISSLLELYAALGTDRDNRDSAAFVAATAHQLLLQYRAVALGEQPSTYVTSDAVSPNLSATLLFLAAGHPSDAAEVMRQAPDPDPDDPRSPIARAVFLLATGRVGAIRPLRVNVPEGTPAEKQAELSLWRRLLDVMRAMSVRYTRGQVGDVTSYIREAISAIRDDAVIRIPIDEQTIQTEVYSSFPGPQHFATLLAAAHRGLENRCLVDVPSPDGPSQTSWAELLSRVLNRRPFLWTNHMDAIKMGMLNVGSSAVLAFPTGAGKSTLSELKIASTVLAGKRVLYLAPTLALVRQVAKNLQDLLPTERLVNLSYNDDRSFADLENSLDGAVWVMTPERCLLLSSVFRDRFSEVGLIVFDECHSLHMTPTSPNRRSVDAMICLLRFLDIAKDADVLLMSAMMKNGEELSAWLNECLGKRSLSFGAAWKPTRQARGSVIFESQEIGALQAILDAAGRRLPQQRMAAQPRALVCLRQAWDTSDGHDYRIITFTEEKTKLKAKRDRRDRPRVNADTSQLAIDISVSAAKRDIKSIVFYHNPSSVFASVHKVGVATNAGQLELADDEARLLGALVEELGAEDYVYLPNSMAGGHHGDLLPYERELVERAFLRQGGPRVIFSTNTLAQGMNLPADQVIIVRTSAYNAQADEYKAIDVHELLNAAGRAGRAGYAANGVVLVIPDYITTFNSSSGRVSGAAIDHLKNEVLSQDDRCLEIRDPIETLLDQITNTVPASRDLLSSLVLKTPVTADVANEADTVRQFFWKSLAAFRASREGRVASFHAQVEAAVAYRSELLGESTSYPTQVICSGTGLLPTAARSLIEHLHSLSFPLPRDPLEWAQWIRRWVEREPAVQKVLYENVVIDDHLMDCLRLWITGAPLVEIESSLGTPGPKLGKLKGARSLIKGPVREVAYMVGLAGQVAAATDLADRAAIAVRASIVSALIREGLDSYEKLVLYQYSRSKFWSRVRTHLEARSWIGAAERDPPSDHESLAELRRGLVASFMERDARALSEG